MKRLKRFAARLESFSEGFNFQTKLLPSATAFCYFLHSLPPAALVYLATETFLVTTLLPLSIKHIYIPASSFETSISSEPAP